jgi:hypothetical protein
MLSILVASAIGLDPAVEPTRLVLVLDQQSLAFSAWAAAYQLPGLADRAWSTSCRGLAISSEAVATGTARTPSAGFRQIRSLAAGT